MEHLFSLYPVVFVGMIDLIIVFVLFRYTSAVGYDFPLQVANHKDPRDACAAIVAESYRLWLQYETRTDDITIIVVHIGGLTEVRGFETPEF